mmetsp:Transcript_17225/g.49242  ORF Transcript_17225/g.49242 Transcript_17225/m.49242 type:complete len:202 (+) Transcript_17225:238-843(+)
MGRRVAQWPPTRPRAPRPWPCSAPSLAMLLARAQTGAWRAASCATGCILGRSRCDASTSTAPACLRERRRARAPGWRTSRSTTPPWAPPSSAASATRTRRHCRASGARRARGSWTAASRPTTICRRTRWPPSGESGARSSTGRTPRSTATAPRRRSSTRAPRRSTLRRAAGPSRAATGQRSWASLQRGPRPTSSASCAWPS